ncbi:MAG: tRNA lysidine(34) synthetase TilS [Desulfovibrio sp.]|jgi:tRNA(Ile)-lysidine synthase|nr:tRNA lysidine(34) synthetase TilS [Desulfovibrio sp.]
MSSPDIHNLSPASARLCLSVERFLPSLGLGKGARLLAAVSGGADSMALVLILRILAPRMGLRVSALTVDHGILPEAGSVAAMAVRQCAALGVGCALKKADVSGLADRERLGLEEAGRKLRYRLLEEERVAEKADYVALGHHNADLAEDVLMRFTRGAGWPALGGMQARNAQRRLVRPLLFIKPQPLRAILRECRIDWFEDPSNSDLRFKRNRMRHTILPALRKENPSLDHAVARLWQFAQTDRDYWEKTLDALLKKVQWNADAPEVALPKGLLRGLHAAVRLRLYHKALSFLAGGDNGKRGTQARGGTLLALDAAYAEGRVNARVQLPGGVEARLDRDTVVFRRSVHVRDSSL